MTQADTKLAEELEADAVAYPEERGEILLEAADAWQRAGQRERAIELLTDLVGHGGEYGCDARVQLADLHLQAGDTELAHVQLAAVAKDPALGGRQCELAAELLAEHGDLVQAARWYDRAAARLTDDQLDALRRRDDWLSMATTIMLRGRQRVRQQLGRTPDMLDELVPPLPSSRDPFTSDDVLELIDTGIKRRYCQSIPDSDTITWPPQRNAACWCGSARKYKKCCGRPN